MTEQSIPTAAMAQLDGFDPKDEPLPFLSNFQDIFLTIGVIILFVGLNIVAFSIAGAIYDGNGEPPLLAFAGLAGGILLVAWLLSEIVVRSRRRILPGIALFVITMAAGFWTFVLGYGGLFGEAAISQFEAFDSVDWADAPNFDGASHESFREAAIWARDAMPWAAKGFILSWPVFAFAISFLYYRRFKLPFASAVAGAGAIGVVVVALLYAFPYDTLRYSPVVGLMTGLVLLIGGIIYDAKDPERVARFSGNGFWYHFLAAPVLLGSVLMIARIGPSFDFTAFVDGDMSEVMSAAFGQFETKQAVITLIVVGIFAVLSLLLNRRALIVSGLISAATAIGVLVKQTGLDGAGIAATTLILLGGGILFIGLGWASARKVVLVLAPSGGVWDRIFPRNDADG